jgi:hypothetical protein
MADLNIADHADDPAGGDNGDGGRKSKTLKDRLMKTNAGGGAKSRSWFGVGKRSTSSEPATPGGAEELTTADRVQHAHADWRAHDSPGQSPSPSSPSRGSNGNSDPSAGREGVSTELDNALGPWRFADPALDMVEDNSFIHLDRALTVAQRRRWFANQEHRKAFYYHPDVFVCFVLQLDSVIDTTHARRVYATSFFSPFCDFNTLDLKVRTPPSCDLHHV